MNFRQVSDTYPTCATILLVVCFLFGRTLTQQRTNEQGCRRYFPSSLRHTGVFLRRSLPCVGRKVCAQKDGLHWVQTWTPWNTNVGTKKASKTAQPPPLFLKLYSKVTSFWQWQWFWISSIFQSNSGMAKKWHNLNFPPHYKLKTPLTLLILLS